MHIHLSTVQDLWALYLTFGGVFGGFCMGLCAGEEKDLPKSARTPFVGLFLTAFAGLLFWPLITGWWAWKGVRS